MDKQYYFMFSNGSYSDYCVGGLYICDHEVSEEEWTEHKAKIAEFRKAHEESAILALYDRLQLEPVRQITHRHPTLPPDVRLISPEGWYGSPEREEFFDRKDILAQETFIEKHKMVQVEYNEMWED